MRSFKIEYEVISRTICFSSVDAETPEEALKLFKKDFYNYDQEEEVMTHSEIMYNSEQCTGEWIKDDKDESLSTLKKFTEPIKL